MKKIPKGIRFAVCIRNRGYEISLEHRKVYELVRDPVSEQHHLLRVIDETGEANLFPASFFLPIELAKATERALAAIW